jgi:hypothetical protein
MSNDDRKPFVYFSLLYSLKAGFAGDDAPKAVFPSIVGTEMETHLYGG